VRRFINLYNRLRGRTYRGKYAVIFMYHGVTATQDMRSNYFGKHVHVELFKEQLECISRYFKIVPLDDLIVKLRDDTLTENSAVITFDDGYRNNFTVAYPVLKSLQAPATIYLTTGFIDSERWFWTDKLEYVMMNTHIPVLTLKSMGTSFDLSNRSSKKEAIIEIKKRLKQCNELTLSKITDEIYSGCHVEDKKPFENYECLKWHEIVEMSKDNISFGAHTVNHIILSRYLFDIAKREIGQSQRIIQEKTMKPVKTFCYPNGMYGDYTDEIKKWIAANFDCALSANYGRVVPGMHDLHELQRIGVGNDTSCYSLARKIDNWR
jgi:peptidoglycan/xylan/chitin deacetylase (PgdA/CDA1 family)